MRAFMRRGLCAVGVAGGITLLGLGIATSSASAAEEPAGTTPAAVSSTTGEDGTGSGNQTSPVAAAPVEASGNQVTVLGDNNESGGSADGGASNSVGSGETTSGADGDGRATRPHPRWSCPATPRATR